MRNVAAAKAAKTPPLKTQCFPEYVPVAERPEPEEVHVIRQRGPAAEDDAGKDAENEKEAAATPRRMRPRMSRRPVNGLGHCLPRYYQHLRYQSSNRRYCTVLEKE